MAHFSKPKRGTAAVPERCSRCQQQQDTTRVHLSAKPDALEDDSLREVWLCDECRLAIKRDAADN